MAKLGIVALFAARIHLLRRVLMEPILGNRNSDKRHSRDVAWDYLFPGGWLRTHGFGVLFKPSRIRSVRLVAGAV